MSGHCPRCKAALDLPQSGAYRCDRCRTRFEVYLLEPRPAPAFDSSAVTWGQPGSRPPAGWGGGRPVPGRIPPAVVQWGYPRGLSPLVTTGESATHADTPAVDICERCGDFMCQVCHTRVEGRRYCPRCFDTLYSRGALQFTHRSFTLPSQSLWTGVAGLLSMSCAGFYGLVSLPAGIGSVVLGMLALREFDRRPELPGRKSAVAGIVCGTLTLLATIGLWGFLIYLIASRGGP